jgi:hypothetical protein
MPTSGLTFVSNRLAVGLAFPPWLIVSFTDLVRHRTKMAGLVANPGSRPHYMKLSARINL